MNKGVKVSIQISVTEMYRFLMANSYYGIKSVFGLGISVCALVLLLSGAVTGWLFYVVFGVCLLFPLLLPLLLLIRSVDLVILKGAKGKVLHYHFMKEGIMLKQDERELEIEWSEVQKVLETKSGFYLYVTSTNALILPKKQCESRVNSVRYILKEHIKAKRLKLIG